MIFSEIGKDEKVKKLVEPAWSPDEVKELLFHQKCLDSYVHPKSLNKLNRIKPEKSAEEDTPSSSNEETLVRKSSRKRDRFGKKFFFC